MGSDGWAGMFFVITWALAVFVLKVMSSAHEALEKRVADLEHRTAKVEGK